MFFYPQMFFLPAAIPNVMPNVMPELILASDIILVSDDEAASPASPACKGPLSPEPTSPASPPTVVSDDDSSDEDVPVEYDDESSDEEPVAKRARSLPPRTPPQVAVGAPALRGYDTTTFFCPLKCVFWQLHADPQIGNITPTFSKVEFNPDDKEWVNNATYIESEL